MNLKDFFLKAHRFNKSPSAMRAVSRFGDSGGTSLLAVLDDVNDINNSMRRMSSWTPSASQIHGIKNSAIQAVDNAQWLDNFDFSKYGDMIDKLGLYY